MRIPYTRIVFPTRQAVRASQQHGAKLRLRSDRSFASKIHESTRPQNRAADGAGRRRCVACQWCRHVERVDLAVRAHLACAGASERVRCRAETGVNSEYSDSSEFSIVVKMPFLA